MTFYVECNKMYLSTVCIQEFWYIMSGLDIQPEQSDNNNSASKQVVPDTIDSCTFFFSRLIWTYGLVVKVSHSE